MKFDVRESYKYLQEYNNWKKNVNISSFERGFYLEQVKDVIGNKLIKVLMGQRRVGKSQILKQVIKFLINEKGINRKNIFYFNKEEFEFNNINSAVRLNKLFKYYIEKIKPDGKVYIFLDEIQDVDEWEKLAASWAQSDHYDYELFITGSNSKMLSSELGTALGGRYLPFYIYPFSYKEFIDYKKLEKGKVSFLKYLKTGGLPELFSMGSVNSKHHYLSSLKDSIILNDIVKKYHIKDINLLERVFLFVVNNPATLFSFKNIVKYLSSSSCPTNYETVTNYLLYLRNALVIHECERYDVKGKALLSGERKFYVNDIAFKKYLSSKFDVGASHHLENLVYLHYKRLGYQVYVGTIYKNEVDFVVERNDIKEYIQVTYLLSDKDVIEREYRSLKKIKDNYSKKVVSMDEISFGDNEGIKHQNIWDLLYQ